MKEYICNNCNWIGNESEVIKGKNGEYCPDCKMNEGLDVILNAEPLKQVTNE